MIIAKAQPNSEAQKPLKRDRNATFAALQWTREMTLDKGEKSLLFALASRIDDDYRAMFPRELLMHDAGIKSPQSFAKYVESLQDKNLIRVGKHSHKGNRWPRNSYELMVPPKYKSQKMDSESDSQNLSDDAQNLSGDSQKMDTNYPYNYPYNYPVEDKQQDEISDPTSGPQTSKIFQKNSGENQEGIDQISSQDKKINFAAHFPVAARFNHDKLSGKAKVCFWWEVIAKYRPDQYHPKKALTNHQTKKLYELYGMFDYKPIRALALIEWTVRHWDTIAGIGAKANWGTPPPQNPTPTWIINNLEICTDYFQDTSPIKMGKPKTKPKPEPEPELYSKEELESAPDNWEDCE